VPIDKGVGRSTPLPRGSKKRERAEAKIDAWLSQVSTDELVSLAAFLGSKSLANSDQQELADELATAIPQLLAPIKNPPTETTIDYIRPPSAPKYRNLSKDNRQALRREIPKGASLKNTYDAIQAAIVDNVTVRWVSWHLVDLTDLPQTRERLQKISSRIKKLVAEVESAPIRVRQIIGQSAGENTEHLDLVTLMNALRETEASITSELQALKPKKPGAPKKRDRFFDDLGERILGRWETTTNQEPTYSKNHGGVLGFTKKLAKVAPVEATVVLTMSFPGSDRSPLEETFRIALTEKDVSAAVDRALRLQRADQAETAAAFPE